MSLSSDIRKFRIKCDTTLDKVYRASVFDLTTAIILGTPVDKGLLRNNWFIIFDTDDSEVKTEEVDKGGRDTIKRTKDKLETADIERVIYIVNNLPYGPRIEFDGWSGKAPDGMVRVALANWERIVEANARKFR